MFLRGAVLLLATLSFGLADTITLRNGQVIQGTFLGGDSRHVRMAVADRIQSFDIADIQKLEFVAEAASVPAPAPPPPAAAAPPSTDTSSDSRPGATILRPDPAAAVASTAPVAGVEIPAGTNLVVRMIDSVDSERDSVGQTFRASLDEPVVVNGDTVIPRGVDVSVKLVDDKESGKLTGKTVLTLDLMSVTVNGRPVEIDTQEATAESASRGSRTGKVVGGTAALGAIIGAIAGGGKGAAIGAASGAGVGAAAQTVTKGQRVRIPSETRLTFTLRQPAKV